MLELNTNYRERMAYRIYAVIGLLMLPFSIWACIRGDFWLGIYAGGMSLLSLYNAFHFHLRDRFLINPVIISMIYILANVWGLKQLGVVAIFWAYPTMLALYWIHSRKIAQQIVPLFFLSVSIGSFLWLPAEYTLRIVTTLLMLGIFFHIASGLMEQQYQDVIRLSITDHLTGAFNRRFMDSKIDELIERLNRTKVVSSMITLDVDHFKSINDHFGHSSGDKVLIEIVSLLKSRVRVLDKVCRAGGEEFVILLPDTVERDAYVLAEHIRRAISDSKLLKQSPITISCGIAALQSGDTRDSWLKRSDQALYAAKESGRNKVVISPSKPTDAYA